MFKIIIGCVVSLFMIGNAQAQDAWHHHNGHWHNHYHSSYHWHNSSAVGYQPIIQYYPQGMGLNIGRAYVSPNRKYIRIGAYGGYWSYQGSPIYYDFRTGTYRPYYRW